MPQGMKPTPAPIRFWRKVDQSGGPDACWPWMGARKPKGYGNFCTVRTPPKTVLAHRYAYEQTHGPIPEGLVLRHRCDNPPCCNPAHLLPGTGAENTQDAIERGLFDPHTSRVTEEGRLRIARSRSHLTDEQARAAMALKGTMSAPKAASQFGVKPCVIYTLWEGITYRHLFK